MLLPLCRVALSSSRGDSREQHIALPGIEGQPGDALGPSDGIIERGGLRRCQSCERAAEQGQLALESGGAHGERRLHARHGIGGVPDVELLARAGPVDHCAVLNQDDVGGRLRSCADVRMAGRGDAAASQAPLRQWLGMRARPRARS